MLKRILNVCFVYFQINIICNLKTINCENDNDWTAEPNIGPLFAVSTLNSIKLYQLTNDLTIDNETVKEDNFREIKRTETYVYDKISVSVAHNLIIYTKINEYSLYATVIRSGEENILGISNETKLNIVKVRSFVVDWIDLNIYITTNNRNRNSIFIYPLRNTTVYYKVNTTNGMINSLLINNEQHFLAWIEDSKRLVYADKDGLNNKIISNRTEIQAINYDNDKQLFYIYVYDNRNITLFSQTFVPFGGEFVEKQIDLPKNNTIMETIFCNIPGMDVGLLLILYGDRNPKRKGFDLKFEFLKSQSMLVIQDYEELKARKSAFITGIRSINHVWSNNVSDPCYHKQCTAISYRLSSGNCVCLCMYQKSPCDRFEYDPDEEPTTKSKSPSPAYTIIQTSDSKDFRWFNLMIELSLYLIPFCLFLCAFIIYWYIVILNAKITNIKKENSSSSSKSNDGNDNTNNNNNNKERSVKTSDANGCMGLYSKDKIKTIVNYFNTINAKPTSKTKYNVTEPEEPSENYLNTDTAAVGTAKTRSNRSSRKLKFKKSKKTKRKADGRKQLSLKDSVKPMKSLKSDKTKSKKSAKDRKSVNTTATATTTETTKSSDRSKKFRKKSTIRSLSGKQDTVDKIDGKLQNINNNNNNNNNSIQFQKQKSFKLPKSDTERTASAAVDEHPVSKKKSVIVVDGALQLSLMEKKQKSLLNDSKVLSNVESDKISKTSTIDMASKYS